MMGGSRALMRPLGAFAFPLATMAIVPSLASAQPEKRPNIVMLMTDDTGWNDFGAYSNGGKALGHPTPNVDRIAEEGATFTTGTGRRAAPLAAPRSSPGAFRSARRCRSSSRRLTRTFSGRRRRRSRSSSRRTAIRPISRASGTLAISPRPIRSNMASMR